MTWWDMAEHSGNTGDMTVLWNRKLKATDNDFEKTRTNVLLNNKMIKNKVLILTNAVFMRLVGFRTFFMPGQFRGWTNVTDLNVSNAR